MENIYGPFYCLDDDRFPYLIEYGAKRFFKHLAQYIELSKERWNGITEEDLRNDPIIVQSMHYVPDNDGRFVTDDIIRITSSTPF